MRDVLELRLTTVPQADEALCESEAMRREIEEASLRVQAMMAVDDDGGDEAAADEGAMAEVRPTPGAFFAPHGACLISILHDPICVGHLLPMKLLSLKLSLCATDCCRAASLTLAHSPLFKSPQHSCKAAGRGARGG
jgi:hypothetical protein